MLAFILPAGGWELSWHWQVNILGGKNDKIQLATISAGLFDMLLGYSLVLLTAKAASGRSSDLERALPVAALLFPLTVYRFFLSLFVFVSVKRAV